MTWKRQSNMSSFKRINILRVICLWGHIPGLTVQRTKYRVNRARKLVSSYNRGKTNSTETIITIILIKMKISEIRLLQTLINHLKMTKIQRPIKTKTVLLRWMSQVSLLQIPKSQTTQSPKERIVISKTKRNQSTVRLLRWQSLRDGEVLVPKEEADKIWVPIMTTLASINRQGLREIMLMEKWEHRLRKLEMKIRWNFKVMNSKNLIGRSIKISIGLEDKID